MRLDNIALSEKGVAILDLVGQDNGSEEDPNIFRGLRLVNKLNKVTLSARFENWEVIPKVPVLCWDETLVNYLSPRRPLSESCIVFPFNPSVYKLPGSKTFNFFKTEVGDWGSSSPG